eukprot:12330876-Heterocapsa_arctica.AAC.1
MVLEPGRGMNKDKQLGVGHAEVKLEAPTSKRRLLDILALTRRAGVAPLAAHRSSPCLLRK